MKNYYYTKGGETEIDAQAPSIYAQQIWNGKYYEYWIKHATSGPDSPHLLNPWGMHFVAGVDDVATTRHLGRPKYDFKKVNESVFKMYVDFLKTGKELYYRHAERELD